MEAERRGAGVAGSVKQRREARADIDLADRRSLSQLLMPAIVPASGALPPSSTGIYCTPSYHRGKSVWTDMTSLYAGSPMIQCKVVVPTSSPSSLEETGDSLDGSTCKKPRTQFTPKQLIYLEDRFAENDLPTFKDREDMARELNLTQMHLQIWFQNRRAKHRRQKRKMRAEQLKQPKPAPPSYWPQHLSFNSSFAAKRKNSASKSSNEQTSEPSSSASVPQPASPTNQALLQSQPPHCKALRTALPSTGSSKSSISTTTAASTTDIYLPISQNGHDAINSSVTTSAVITKSPPAPVSVMSGTAKIMKACPVSLPSATSRPISNGLFTPPPPGVQPAPLGYTNSVVARTTPCTSTSFHFDCSSQNATKSKVTTPNVTSFSKDTAHPLPPHGDLCLLPVVYPDAVVTRPSALSEAAARQALMLETLSSTAASLMARAGALVTTSCAGGSCSVPLSVVSHRPTSLELINPMPTTNGAATGDILHDLEGMCNGNPLISATCRRSSSDSSLDTPEGNRSLDSSVSSGSKTDFLCLPRQADTLRPDFPLSGLTSPIFAEEPVTLADILQEEWDLFDVTPSREHCPLPAVNPVLPPHHQALKVVQSPVPEPSHLHHPYLYSTQPSMPLQNGYHSAGLHRGDLVINHNAALPPQHPSPYSMSHYHHPHLTPSRSIGDHFPHYHCRPHHFVPPSPVSVINHHSSGVLFSSQ